MSTRIVKLGRTSFAFGLQWIDTNAAEIRDVLADLDDSSGAIHYVIAGAQPRGLFSLSRPKGDAASTESVVGLHHGHLKGSVASYAATLAKVAENGAYLIRLDEAVWWYCTIHNGRVGASTDLLQTPSGALEILGVMVNSSVHPRVFADEHCLPFVQEMLASHGLPVNRFDPAAIVAKAKPIRLTRRGTSKVEIVVAALILVGAIAGFGWAYQKVFPKQIVSSGPTPEEIREMYLSTMRSLAPTLSADPAWTVQAFKAARAEFPAFRSGWSLETVACSPRDGCSGNYAPAPGSVWYSHETLGVVSQPTATASRSVSVPITLLQPTDDELLYSFPSTGRPVGEVVGTFGLRFASAQMQAAPTVDDLSLMTGQTMPDGAVTLLADRVVVGKTAVLDGFLATKVSAYFADEGFRANALVYAHGYGTQSSSWRIEFVRIRSDY